MEERKEQAECRSKHSEDNRFQGLRADVMHLGQRSVAVTGHLQKPQHCTSVPDASLFGGTNPLNCPRLLVVSSGY